MKPLHAAALLGCFVFAGALQAIPITYTSTDVPKPIPDLSTATSVLTIPDNYLISDLNVQINLTHTFDSDLVISLISPGGGTTVILANGRGGAGDNFTNTIFDDSAANPISLGTAPFTGTFSPEQPLSGFNGLNIAGTWTLRIVDTFEFDSGTLLGWSITADSAGATPEPAAFALAGLGLLGLAALKRSSRR